MLYIIIALIIFAGSVIIGIHAYRQDDDNDLVYTPFIGGLILLGVLIGLSMYGDAHSENYLTNRSETNPIQTHTIEALPFETATDAINNVYVVKDKDAQNNSRYYYCIKTEDGYKEKFVSSLAVSFEYIDAGEQPHLKYYSDTRHRVLVKKPSFWFNFFGWLEYKDFEIGDTYDTWGETNAKYVFCVPKGSLREKEISHGID